MMAQDRVRVVERWIQVAQECKILKNFSSPCTVISVLQKTSICHLKNTWGKFPGGESSEKLKEHYSQDESLSRELMTKGNGRMVIVWCRPHMGVMRRGLPRLPLGNQPP
ncbi:ral guanine nucleotide dissociation stimulator-like [Diceros bicornis minor]|uniref:ral guanine nucleotide dissociation stimulator-like n=1 Tax=Diceros bicornis minor TaxID=77932 RepID=UPI0026F2942C|nr:ral guanine nucleotide dissociation stimulator-like [Diceros bicornis minor]